MKKFLSIIIILLLTIFLCITFRRFQRKADNIIEPVFTQDCFPRTLQQKGVTKECFENANFGRNNFCSQPELNMIKEYYTKGQDKDPLNNGSGQFCAE